MYQNAGVTMVASQDTTTSMYENIGVAPPVSQSVRRSLQGWGPLVVDGPLEADVLINSSNATVYNYEGDVTV